MWSCNTQYAKYDYNYKYLFRDANMSQFCSWSSNCATCNNFLDLVISIFLANFVLIQTHANIFAI